MDRTEKFSRDSCQVEVKYTKEQIERMVADYLVDEVVVDYDFPRDKPLASAGVDSLDLAMVVSWTEITFGVTINEPWREFNEHETSFDQYVSLIMEKLLRKHC